MKKWFSLILGLIVTSTAWGALGDFPNTFSDIIVLPAGTTDAAPLQIPHGAAPTTPTNGDIWTTTLGVYVRVNGSTVGPLVDTAGAGSGDVTGPSSATDNAIVRFDTTTGKLVQNSVVTIDDDGDINVVANDKYLKFKESGGANEYAVIGTTSADNTLVNSQLGVITLRAQTLDIAEVNTTGLFAQDSYALGFVSGSFTQTQTQTTLTANRAVTWPDAAGEVSLLGQTIESAEITDGTIVAADTAITGTPTGSKFLRDDWTWNVPAGAGDVVGPGSSTANAFAIWADTSGALLADSTFTTSNVPKITAAAAISGVWEIQDDTAFSWGNDADIQVLYDETTDNRLEASDGSNLLAYLTDAGTTGNLGATGSLLANTLTVHSGTTATLYNTTATTVNAFGAATTITLSASAGGTTALNVGDPSNGANVVNLKGPAGQNRGFYFYTGSSRRWSFSVTNTAESGSDAGSNFALGAYTDASAFIDYPLLITRAAGGSITLGRPVSISGSNNLTVGGDIAVNGGDINTTAAAITFGDPITTIATATGAAGFNLPHGTAPSSPNNGDLWTTTGGLYARINGATVGPLDAGGGDVTAAAALTDNTVLRGDGGSKGIQDSGVTIDDSDNIVSSGSIISTSKVTITADDQTPSVSGVNMLIIPNSGWTAATNITDFDDGTDGQIITVVCGLLPDTDCVIEDGGALALNGNFTAGANDSIMLIYHSAEDYWTEISRSAN